MNPRRGRDRREEWVGFGADRIFIGLRGFRVLPGFRGLGCRAVRGVQLIPSLPRYVQGQMAAKSCQQECLGFRVQGHSNGRVITYYFVGFTRSCNVRQALSPEDSPRAAKPPGPRKPEP